MTIHNVLVQFKIFLTKYLKFLFKGLDATEYDNYNQTVGLNFKD